MKMECEAILGKPSSGPFNPVARYHRGMDHLTYISEDCACTTEPIDGFLTLLWHPTERRLVGVKIKGIRNLFLTFQELFKWTEEDFARIVRVLETLLKNAGNTALGITQEERKKKYETARKFVVDRHLRIPDEELRRIERDARKAA